MLNPDEEGQQQPAAPLRTRSDQVRPGQTRTDQVRPHQTRSDHIRPGQTRSGPRWVTEEPVHGLVWPNKPEQGQGVRTSVSEGQTGPGLGWRSWSGVEVLVWGGCRFLSCGGRMRLEVLEKQSWFYFLFLLQVQRWGCCGGPGPPGPSGPSGLQSTLVSVSQSKHLLPVSLRLDSRF